MIECIGGTGQSPVDVIDPDAKVWFLSHLQDIVQGLQEAGLAMRAGIGEPRCYEQRRDRRLVTDRDMRYCYARPSDGEHRWLQQSFSPSR